MATPGANPHQHASNGTSHPSGGAEALIPDRDMLIQFVDVMFRNAAATASCRSACSRITARASGRS